MRGIRSPLDVKFCMAMVLGQVSMWMGILVALGWTVMFSIVARHVLAYRGEASGLMLPMEPPSIGLTLGSLSVAFALLGRQSIPASAVAGVLLNALALSLALSLLAGCLS